MILEQVPRFLEGVRARLEVQAEIEAHLATSFDYFSRFIITDEDRMSAVFAYLLNPEETHGQGELFLREFLEDVPLRWLSESGWSRVYLGEQVATTRIENSDRKMDIEIAFRLEEGLAAIAIENKPWEDSVDECQQLHDYSRHLESKYEGRFKLVYLTPDGRNPARNSIGFKERAELEKKGQLGCASIGKWASDDGWLKRSEDEVKAERVRWFVSDFRKALKTLSATPTERA